MVFKCLSRDAVSFLLSWIFNVNFLMSTWVFFVNMMTMMDFFSFFSRFFRFFECQAHSIHNNTSISLDIAICSPKFSFSIFMCRRNLFSSFRTLLLPISILFLLFFSLFCKTTALLILPHTFNLFSSTISHFFFSSFCSYSFAHRTIFTFLSYSLCPIPWNIYCLFYVKPMIAICRWNFFNFGYSMRMRIFIWFIQK